MWWKVPVRLVLAAALVLGFVRRPAHADAPLASINLPIEDWTVIAYAKGFLQEAYARIGITDVRLVDPGTTQLSGAEAALLDRGGLALAQRIMYPATIHKANGIDASIVWLSTRSSPARTPVLALADSPVQTVADLKGKTLGSSRVSCGWTSPTEILDTAGVPLDTPKRAGAVRFANIINTVAVTNALLSGRIDATATHIAIADNAALWTSGQVKAIGRSPDNGVYVNNAGRVSYFAMREFADQHPHAIQAFLQARERTAAWVKDNQDEAIQLVAKGRRLPIEIARFTLTDPSSFSFIDGEPSAQAAAGAVKAFQAWYLAHGDEILADHHLTDEQIDAFVDQRFFQGGEYSVY
jgi:ABC-type nitrate/sulfonate/bicarbonate transport system substrate-binding protein